MNIRVDEAFREGRLNVWSGDIPGSKHGMHNARTIQGEGDSSSSEAPTSTRIDQQHHAEYLNLLSNFSAPQDSDNSNCQDSWLRTIERIGQAGGSSWPVSWHIVNKMASEIPDRLYFTEAKIAQGKTQENDDDSANQPPPPQSQSGASISKHQQEHTVERKRSPSAISNCQFETKKIRYEIDGEALQYLLPSTDISDGEGEGGSTSSQAAIGIGSLRNVGETHNGLQLLVDSSKENATLSNRQRRRKYRKAIRERLGQHEVEKNHDPQTYRSKVLKTTSKVDNNKHTFDLDLQPCLLETRNGDRRTLCLFSSVEINIVD